MQKYAVVDIEATGGTQKVDRIIEIGLVTIDGNEIIDTYSTLINPGISIPPFITKLTGISNEMVSSAPQFHEIARIIVERTEGRSLVAHNVSFDYRILREEFERLGYEFRRDTLCTARLAKHFFPNVQRYNLSTLAKELDITLDEEHRASHDAMATTEVFLRIMNANQDSGLELKNMTLYKKKSRLPDRISEEAILDLPNVCGVYYMLGEDNEPVYIGKSLKIRSRIRSHFSDEKSNSDKMRKLVCAFRYQVTGSELMAELLEGVEIRKYRPLLNRAKRKSKYDYGLYVDRAEMLHVFKINHKSSIPKGKQVIQWFASKSAAKAYVQYLQHEHQLCKCLNSHSSRSTGCFEFKLGNCSGAGVGMEISEQYNERIEHAVQTSSRILENDFILISEGPDDAHQGCYIIQDGHLRAFGLINTDDDVEIINENIGTFYHIDLSPEMDRIVYRHIHAKQYIKKWDGVKLSSLVNTNI